MTEQLEPSTLAALGSFSWCPNRTSDRIDRDRGLNERDDGSRSGSGIRTSEYWPLGERHQGLDLRARVGVEARMTSPYSLLSLGFWTPDGEAGFRTGSGIRTHTGLRPADFESAASSIPPSRPSSEPWYSPANRYRSWDRRGRVAEAAGWGEPLPGGGSRCIENAVL